MAGKADVLQRQQFLVRQILDQGELFPRRLHLFIARD
jgi:hypothetical protein